MDKYPYLLYRNIDKWRKTDNVLFITGAAGEGKTTLSRQLAAENHVKKISIDDILNLMFYDHLDSFSKPLAIKYRDLNPSIAWGKITWKTPNISELLDQYIAWLYDECRKLKYNVIIEGIEIANGRTEFFDFYKDKSIIIIGVERSMNRLWHLDDFINYLGYWEFDIANLGKMIHHYNWGKPYIPIKDGPVPDPLPEKFDIEYLPNMVFTIHTARPNWLTDDILETHSKIAEKTCKMLEEHHYSTGTTDHVFDKIKNTKNSYLVDPPFILANLVDMVGLYLNEPYDAYIHRSSTYRILFVKIKNKVRSLLIDTDLNPFAKECGTTRIE